MQIPVMRGVIDRRILANYRMDAEVMARWLPRPFLPQLVAGYAMAGICLIRLKQVRPRWLPLPWGLGSENAAHRVAVEWDEAGQTRSGVYIPRRDTSSRLNHWAGGTLFPGLHHRATFTTAETSERLSVGLVSDDGLTRVQVTGRVTDQWPATSVFSTLAEASEFFALGSLGYSITHTADRYDGLELQCNSWRVEPLAIETIASSFFEDEMVFPRGSVAFDCALLMRGIEHTWHARGEICCADGMRAV